MRHFPLYLPRFIILGCILMVVYGCVNSAPNDSALIVFHTVISSKPPNGGEVKFDVVGNGIYVGDRTVATVAHVFMSPYLTDALKVGAKVTGLTSSGRVLAGSLKVVQFDYVDDIALVTLDSDDKLEPLHWCVKEPRIGETVLTIDQLKPGTASKIIEVNAYSLKIDKILDHGQSGGAIVSADKNCMYGIISHSEKNETTRGNVGHSETTKEEFTFANRETSYLTLK